MRAFGALQAREIEFGLVGLAQGNDARQELRPAAAAQGQPATSARAARRVGR